MFEPLIRTRHGGELTSAPDSEKDRGGTTSNQPSSYFMNVRSYYISSALKLSMTIR